MYVSSAAALARALLAPPLCDSEAALATVEGHSLPLFFFLLILFILL
jgi:hypothetical protein